MPKVAVLGYYGQGNFGDDLILEGLRRLFSGWDIEVMSTVTGGSYPALDIKKVNECDLFVFGGGELIRKDCLGMPTPSRLQFKNHSLAYRIYNRTFLAHAPWVKQIKIPKVVLGCGVDAEKPSDLTPNVLEDLRQFDYIGVRELASFNLLNTFPALSGKVHLFYDLAYALYEPQTRKPKGCAIVFPTDRECAYVVSKSEKWLCNQLKPYRSAVFVPFGKRDNNDYATCQRLAICADSPIIMDPNTVSFDHVKGVLVECSFAVAYRLHGLILAHMFGVPHVFYPYHKKLTRINQVVQTNCASDISAAQLFEFKQTVEGLVC